MIKKGEVYDLADVDEIEVRIIKRKNGLAIALNSPEGPILEISELKGPVTVHDERPAISPSPLPQSRPSAHRSAAKPPKNP